MVKSAVMVKVTVKGVVNVGAFINTKTKQYVIIADEENHDSLLPLPDDSSEDLFMLRHV